jgi:hypothetical protein
VDRFKFYSNCVDWPEHDVEELCAMIASGKDITRGTFLRHVDQAVTRSSGRLSSAGARRRLGKFGESSTRATDSSQNWKTRKARSGDSRICE